MSAPGIVVVCAHQGSAWAILGRSSGGIIGRDSGSWMCQMQVDSQRKNDVSSNGIDDRPAVARGEQQKQRVGRGC